MDFIVVLSLAAFATLIVRRYRRPRLLPAPPTSSLSEPARKLVEELTSLGFTASDARRARPKNGDPIFAPADSRCRACAGSVYALSRCQEVKTEWFEGYEERVFGTACANCHMLKRIADEEIPPSIRPAWTEASDLTDFLLRMRRGPDEKRPLAERKAWLERALADTEARRDELRSQLLSVKNRLGEPDDGPPHR